jgi:oligopeptidase B
MLFNKIIITSIILFIISSSLLANTFPTIPVAPIHPDTTRLNGKLLIDNYGWMKDPEFKNQDVMDYIQQENAYTDAYMKQTLPLQKELFKEMNKRIIQSDQTVPYYKDGYFYYSKDVKGKQYPVYCRRKSSMKAKEEIILDVNKLAKGHEFYSIGTFEYSPNRRYLAFSVDLKGDETYKLFVKDLQTGQFLKDTIYPLDGLAWANDNKTFFYTLLNIENESTDKVFRHTLGETTPDSLMYLEKDRAFNIGIGRSEDEKQILLTTSSHTTSECYYVSADNPYQPFSLYRKRIPELQYYLSFHDDDVFNLSNENNAVNFQILAGKLNEKQTSPMKEELAPSDSVVISGFTTLKNYLAIEERVNGEQKILIRSLINHSDHYISFPEQNYSLSIGYTPNYDSDTLRLYYTSFNTPSTVFDYNMNTRELKLLKQDKAGNDYVPDNYVSTMIYAVAEDGTKIPIALNYRKDMFKHDGTNPLYLEAYGSYGDTSDPYFSSYRLSLLNRGFIYAYAHVRGGGEFGQKWHDAGRMLNKMNTFTDFIACAQYLEDEKYTCKEKMVIDGGSAGGLLIGAVINMRPKLFQIAVAEVPFVDVLNTMLDPNLYGVVPEYEEWGNPDIPVYGDYILSYCPYQNVKAQNYPTLLITEGLNDPRVNYWESLKWTAKLRALKTDHNPLLLHMSMEGHLGASGRYGFTEEIAYTYAFILNLLGIK